MKEKSVPACNPLLPGQSLPTKAGKVVFVIVSQQKPRQAVRHFFYEIFIFLRYKKEPSALRVPLRSSLSCLLRSFLFLMAASFVFLALAFRASRQKLKIHRLPCLARLRVAAGFGWICFICLRFALAIKAVASCSALRAVMVFAGKSKNTRQPSTSTCAVHRPRPSGSLSATLAPLAGRLARAWPVSATRSAIAPLIAATVQPFSRRRFFLLLPPHQYHS